MYLQSPAVDPPAGSGSGVAHQRGAVLVRDRLVITTPARAVAAGNAARRHRLVLLNRCDRLSSQRRQWSVRSVRKMPPPAAHSRLWVGATAAVSEGEG